MGIADNKKPLPLPKGSTPLGLIVEITNVFLLFAKPIITFIAPNF